MRGAAEIGSMTISTRAVAPSRSSRMPVDRHLPLVLERLGEADAQLGVELGPHPGEQVGLGLALRLRQVLRRRPEEVEDLEPLVDHHARRGVALEHQLLEHAGRLRRSRPALPARSRERSSRAARRRCARR